MYVVGELISETFDTGATGETFTTTKSYLDGVELAWEPEFEEVGGGFYLYRYYPEIAGGYAWSGTGSKSGSFNINFDVDVAGEVTPAPPEPALAGTTALIDLVEAVALRSLDLLQPQATATSEGPTTFTDVNHLVEDNAFFAGMELYIKDGLNAGLTRRVASSDYLSGTLSWVQPLPVAIAEGTKADLFNRAGLGHTYQEYVRAINMVIVELANNAMRRVQVQPTTLPTSSTPYVDVDGDQISKVCSVSYQDMTGAIQHLRRNKQNGWWAQNGDGAIQFTGNGLGVISSLTTPITLHGYQKASQLVLPSDRTFIDPEWLAETAAGLLQNANPDNAGNLAPGQYLRNRADAMRGKMATPFDANCVSVV